MIERGTAERERLEALERSAREPEPPRPEPAVLALQHSLGNAAVARLLQRQPNLTVSDRGYDAAFNRVYAWFDELAAEVRKTEAGSPIQSVAELVYIACELTYTDDDGKPAKVRDRLKPSDIERYIRERAKHEGIVLLDHRDLADVRGVQAEAAAIVANLGRIPTEVTWGGDADHITISLFGKVSAQAQLGGLKVEGEASPGGVEGKASVGGAKVSTDLKSVKAEVKAGDFVTVKGSLQPDGEGRVSWSAQITIGTLGYVAGAEDLAKVMLGAQKTFASSGAALLRDHGVEGLAAHGGPLKDAVTDVADKARKSAAQGGKPGWSVGATVKGDKTGGYSGTVTFTWVF